MQFPVNETGLYTIIVHNTVFSGKAPSEGFQGEVELITVLPIQNGPTIRVTPPSAVVHGNVSIPIAINGTSIVSATYSVDSSPPVSINGSGTTLKINTASLPDGNHSVTISVSDMVGHVSTRAFTFGTLNTGPTIFIGNPPPGAVVNGLVNITYSVQGSRITSTTLSVDGSIVDVHPAGSSSYMWNSTSATDGTHSVKLSATNAAGANDSASISFTTNNQLLAQQRSQERDQVIMLNSEVTYLLVALAIALVAVGVLALRRRPLTP